MKFLHTADWQMGMKASHVGPAAEQVREARFEAIRRIQALARDTRAEFVLVAGDTFEDHGVSAALLREVGDLLAGFDCPVYLIPGNHDPYVPGGVWQRAARDWSRRIDVLTERRPVEIPGGVLYPCPLLERWSGDDPTAWIPAERLDGIRLGLAHGSLAIAPWESERHHPIDPSVVERTGLDYLALGDWHSVKLLPAAGGTVRAAYSGTPEPCSFGEPESGFVLLVEIDTPGAPPRIEKHRVAQLSWLQLEVEITSPGEIARLLAQLRSLRDPRHTLVRVELSGLLFAGDTTRLEELEQLLEQGFLFGEILRDGLTPAPGDSSWIENLPAGVIREAADRLRRQAADNPVAAQALLELFRLAQEVRK